MTKLQQSLVTMNTFSLGLILPILNLVLLERGANLKTLPVLMAIYAFTVLSFELPSGICADLYGRKTVFLISCVSQLLSLLLILLSNHIIWLIFAVIFNGLSRAFSSGSLDALIIDQSILLHGKSGLSKVTSQLAVFEAIGLASGGIVGGFISYIQGSYHTNLILRIIFTIIIFILCFYYIKECEPQEEERSSTVSLQVLYEQGKSVIFSCPLFLYIFGGLFFLGLFLITIETYWQVAYITLLNTDDLTWILGIITFLGFFATAAGNTVSQKLLVIFNSNHWTVYNVSRIIFAVCIIIFAVQKSNIGFIFSYAGIYFFLGFGNVAENTLINQFTPNHMRASILSLGSFIIQAGVMFGSVLSSLLIERLYFTGLWIITGILLGGYSLFVMVIAYITYNKKGLRLNEWCNTEVDNER